MTDMELAEEIERRRLSKGHSMGYEWLNSDEYLGVLLKDNAGQIIAALRRVPSDDPMSSGYIPLCAGHAETWFTGRDHLKDGMKATCVVCAFERPPSGEMVMMRGMRLADEMVDAMNQCRLSIEGSARQAEWREAHDKARRELVAMLSAAEASKEAK